MVQETPLGPSFEASVVLEVGGDVGALVLYTPESFLGLEIEISPAHDAGARTHTAVRERRLPDQTLYAAVYPQLACGPHTLWSTPGAAAGTVDIVGGAVTEVHWSDLVAPARPGQPGGAPAATSPPAHSHPHPHEEHR